MSTLGARDKVAVDVLLFKDERSGFYKVLSFGGSLLGIVCFYNGLTMYQGLGGVASRFDRAKAAVRTELPEDASWWQRYKARLFRVISGDKLRLAVTSVMCLFGLAFVAAATLIPTKCVHKLSLLQGGNRVSIVTFGPYGLSRNHKVKIDDVTSKLGRQPRHSSTFLQVKGHPMGFSLDNVNGKFFNTQVFDFVVGVQRTFRKL